LHRAARNYTENMVLFVAAVMLLRAANISTSLTHWGAYLWIGGRIAYLPGYVSGKPWVRTVFWQISMIGLIMMLVPILL
jgi:uncharacterized MAPEG superfamily protein